MPNTLWTIVIATITALAVTAATNLLLTPGQTAYQRAYRDYQARMLTDAVVTAIARAEHFTDGFLSGLFPVPRHRSALGLWFDHRRDQHQTGEEAAECGWTHPGGYGVAGRSAPGRRRGRRRTALVARRGGLGG
ncbi:hypothetical protein [Streptomyces xantholiticus]|uniref:hypothetical protein n=1 Tax=Streptomyces xantholiticus TaxID=68285 RepID=UPI0016719C2E|nr:hypothetical protein [Streptomyces xantholiticus]GGW69955.1 hypothetical protein GCM10010381_63470 [Streptomyces xantholiticus]